MAPVVTSKTYPRTVAEIAATEQDERDLAALVRDFDCKTIVLTPQDGAWSRDPFAASVLFTRVEESDGKWRIYRAGR